MFPAIDLMDGKVVRLFQGDLKTARKYDYLGEPVTIAKKWEKEGADAIHIIDLDAAFNRGNNLATIYGIVNAVKLPVHVGGGIRSVEKAENLLNIGVRYVMIGTLAFKKPEAIAKLVEKYGDRIIIALDHINGKVMVEGWKTSADMEVEDALRNFLKFQVRTFLLTSINRDGTLEGIDVDILSQACNYKEARIIAAGGVCSLRDLVILKRIGVYGVVIGKALYEGIFTLKEALKVARENS
ncbi:MAG: 1-(5-phosphoribosyl)-5-[(5-phosphoribosylamino)methylideneamino]imidazole-4-carboxamide isomerase [Candidatus Bathyarchaeia archaeon]